MGLLKLRTMHLCESVGFSLCCLLSFIVKSNIAIYVYIWKRLIEHLVFLFKEKGKFYQDLRITMVLEREMWKILIFFRNCS